MNRYDMLMASMLGFVIGDVLGAPFEGKARGTFVCKGFDKPKLFRRNKFPWTDDTAISLATLDALSEILPSESDDWLINIMNHYMQFGFQTKYNPNEDPIDIGSSINRSLRRYALGMDISKIGDTEYYFNGNGALMRCWPLAFIENITDKQIIRFAALTHAHPLNGLCCVYFVRYLQYQMALKDKSTEYVQDFELFIKDETILKSLSMDEVISTGYVYYSLQAALWSFLNSRNYWDAVLTAINLGSDTDTIGAITGVLAGVHYGFEVLYGISEPRKILKRIERSDFIFEIVDQFARKTKLLNEYK